MSNPCNVKPQAVRSTVRNDNNGNGLKEEQSITDNGRERPEFLVFESFVYID